MWNLQYLFHPFNWSNSIFANQSYMIAIAGGEKVT